MWTDALVWLLYVRFSSLTCVTYLGIGLSLFLWLRPGIPPQLSTPVFIYVLVISTMSWRANARVFSRKSGAISQWMALFGAIIFMVSDLCIAIDKFYTPLSAAKFKVHAKFESTSV